MRTWKTPATADDIACWFIDTNYDGESFFVRLAYFTGAGDPYDKLKRALKVEIDEAAWSELYQTTGQPLPRPVPKVRDDMLLIHRTFHLLFTSASNAIQLLPFSHHSTCHRLCTVRNLGMRARNK